MNMPKLPKGLCEIFCPLEFYNLTKLKINSTGLYVRFCMLILQHTISTVYFHVFFFTCYIKGGVCRNKKYSPSIQANL